MRHLLKLPSKGDASSNNQPSVPQGLPYQMLKSFPQRHILSLDEAVGENDYLPNDSTSAFHSRRDLSTRACTRILRGVFPVPNPPCSFLYGIGISLAGLLGSWYRQEAVFEHLG